MNIETTGRIRRLTICLACAVAAAALTACASSPVQYLPDAEQVTQGPAGDEPPPGSATLEFTTNSAAISVFQERVGDQLCEPDSQQLAARVRRREVPSASIQNFRGLANFMSFGALDRIEKLPRTQIAHYPAGQPIAFAASVHITDGSCGPLFLRFTPQEAKRYSLSMDLNGKICSLNVRELDETAQALPVKHSRWRCLKPVWGFGKHTLVGPNEIN
jgi:hypothetical protein